MGNKFTPIIIIILLAVLVGIVFFMFNLFLSDNSDNQEVVEEEVKVKPVIELSKNIDEENKEIATITVNASTEDGTEIDRIELPDQTTVVGNTATFEVTQNGDYTFTVYAVNGESESSTINVSEIEEISEDNPYIPEGFTEVGGYPDSGFVIEDEFENQYVWVPVATGKLTRDTILDKDYEESNSTATELVNSVAKYHGFYIARYESSQYDMNGETVAATISGKNPWTNINCQDAINYASASAEAFGYTDCKTSLINSYAWDTTLAWIDTKVTNFSSSTSYGNYSETIYPTGYTSQDNVNNICDLSGNVREWTTEIYKESQTSESNNRKDEELNLIYRVVRGGSANLKRTPKSHIGYAEETADAYWGFRMILYKN